MGKNELLEGMYQAAYRELTENILPWWSGCAFDKKQGFMSIYLHLDFEQTSQNRRKCSRT